jgi:L-arabinokinase
MSEATRPSESLINGNETFPDVLEFIDYLRTSNSPRIKNHWDSSRTTIVTRAPGRLDVMGGIADYSGSLVLQLPIREATLVALQKNEDRRLEIISLSDRRDEGAAHFSMSLDDFLVRGEPIGYEEAKAFFRRDPRRPWAAYVAGTFLVLMREKGIDISEGVQALIRSDVPEGKGVASSAALEVASMSALDAAYDLSLPSRELAILCQKVENLVVGAPCGVMDQMTAALGEARRLLALLCQPAEIQGTVPLPEELAVWGIDSGIQHAVSGADYGSVRVGAFMGYRILRELSGSNWGGYLANVSPSEFEHEYAARLPEEIKGEDFLEKYGKTGDPVTTIDPDINYRVRQPTAHPIYEHFRVKTFERLVRGDAGKNAPLLGELMYQSHASYSACGLGSEGTDRLVELARAAGAARGIYGAKITGGGSGGTVALLGHRDAEKAAREIAAKYAAETGRQPDFFTGSSPGAASFGHIVVEP